jgi:hypothetical protein
LSHLFSLYAFRLARRANQLAVNLLLAFVY